jgi:hypothetical protein
VAHIPLPLVRGNFGLESLGISVALELNFLYGVRFLYNFSTLPLFR